MNADQIHLNFDWNHRGLGGRVGLAPPHAGAWDLTGRNSDLRRLHLAVQSAEPGTIVPIFGLGGIGKSALTASYMSVCAQDYDLLAWVNADKPTLIPAQLRALVMNQNGTSVRDDEATAAARAIFANRSNWLVVFDNVSDPDALYDYLPSGDGCVLATTRDEAWASSFERHIDVGPLDPDSVAAWIERALPASDHRSVARLVERLDGLPLAVVQALAYIKARPGEDASTYLRAMATKTGQREVLVARKPANYPTAVASTWDVAMEALSEETPSAVELLRYLSFLDADGVDLDFLLGLPATGASPAALEALRSYGMATCTNETVRVHRLVQDVTRWPLARRDEQRYVSSLSDAIAGAAGDPEDHATFEWYREAARHALNLIDDADRIGVNPKSLGLIANQCCISLHLQGVLQTARVLAEAAVAIREEALGPRHLQTGRSLALLATMERSYGNAELALQHGERALKIARKHLGSSNQIVASILNNLGTAYMVKGDYPRALRALEESAKACAQSVGKQHPEYVNTVANLGNVQSLLEHHEEAVSTLRRALQLAHSPTMPRDHRYGSVLTNASQVYRRAGLAKEALAQATAAVEFYRATFGTASPNVANSLVLVSESHLTLGNRRKGRKVRREALEIFDASYGPSHPSAESVRVWLESH